MLKECPLPLPRALPLPLSGIINFGLPPIVSIPLFHHFTFNILVYRSIAAITTIYLFLALLLPNLLYLVYLNILVIIIFFYLHGCTLLKCYLSFSYSGVPFQSAFYHIIAGFTLPHSSVTFSSPPLCCYELWKRDGVTALARNLCIIQSMVYLCLYRCEHIGYWIF